MEDSLPAMPTDDVPKYVKQIENFARNKMKDIKNARRADDTSLERRQAYFDEVLQVYREAFNKLSAKTVTCASLLKAIQNSYEQSIQIRDARVQQLLRQKKTFGGTPGSNQQHKTITALTNENDHLKQQNIRLSEEMQTLRKALQKLQDEELSSHLCLMKERDARYTLYFENLKLHLKLRQLDGSGETPDDARGDPFVLRIALDRCRELLTNTQREVRRMKEEYEETVPQREYDRLQTERLQDERSLREHVNELLALKDRYEKVAARCASAEEELGEMRERCAELSRTGTPRPRWALCGDVVVGGRARWAQLTEGLSSRDTLAALLRELGHRHEYFEGLGTDPSIPPYLRYDGEVRNLRLSRREIAVIINDIWTSRMNCDRDEDMQDFVTKYFEDRYRQSSVRAEWAYNLCSGAEQMLDDAQVKLFWGVLHGHLSIEIYSSHRKQWYMFRENLYSKGRESLTIEEFERIAKSTFPLKSDVDIKNMTDVVRKQLKLKMSQNDINLDRLFKENEEGFDRLDLSRELYRQRQLAQDKYIRELVAELKAKQRTPLVTVENLKRAFVIVDPAIDHIRMEKNVRCVFAAPSGDLHDLPALPLRTVAARLAANDVPRVGPRHYNRHK